MNNDIYFVRPITSHYIYSGTALRRKELLETIEFFILIFSSDLPMQLLKSFSQEALKREELGTFPKELSVFVAIFEWIAKERRKIFLWLLP